MEVNFKSRLKHIKMFVFDVDGVLTDGTLIVMPDGEFLRKMNIKDGYAMQHAIKAGYLISIISGGHSTGVPIRLKRLGINEVHMGVTDKLEVFRKIIDKYQLKKDQTLFMGDDIPDIPLMKACGAPSCPADAVTEIKELSEYISMKNGGEGCARDVIEQVMRVQEKWH